MRIHYFMILFVIAFFSPLKANDDLKLAIQTLPPELQYKIFDYVNLPFLSKSIPFKESDSRFRKRLHTTEGGAIWNDIEDVSSYIIGKPDSVFRDGGYEESYKYHIENENNPFWESDSGGAFNLYKKYITKGKETKEKGALLVSHVGSINLFSLSPSRQYFLMSDVSKGKHSLLLFNHLGVKLNKFDDVVTLCKEKLETQAFNIEALAIANDGKTIALSDDRSHNGVCIALFTIENNELIYVGGGVIGWKVPRNRWPRAFEFNHQGTKIGVYYPAQMSVPGADYNNEAKMKEHAKNYLNKSTAMCDVSIFQANENK